MGNNFFFPVPVDDYTVSTATANGISITFSDPKYITMLENHIACGKVPKLVFQNDTYFGICENYFFNKTSSTLAVSYFQSSNQWTPQLTDKSLPMYFLIEN